jgi:Holliday junction resolvase-like predicted endonuclease
MEPDMTKHTPIFALGELLTNSARRPTYDRKCYDLAEHFLQDHPQFDDRDNRVELAGVIQDAIEDHIAHFWNGS